MFFVVYWEFHPKFIIIEIVYLDKIFTHSMSMYTDTIDSLCCISFIRNYFWQWPGLVPGNYSLVGSSCEVKEMWSKTQDETTSFQSHLGRGHMIVRLGLTNIVYLAQESVRVHHWWWWWLTSLTYWKWTLKSSSVFWINSQSMRLFFSRFWQSSYSFTCSHPLRNWAIGNFPS